MNLGVTEPVNFKIRNWDIVMPKRGRVLLKLNCKRSYPGGVWLHHPEYRHIFNISEDCLGKTFDLGAFPAQTRLVFALVTLDGNIYRHLAGGTTAPDDCGFVKLQQQSDRWEVRRGGKSTATEVKSSGIAIDIDIADEDLLPADERAAMPPYEAAQPISSSVSGSTTDSYATILSWNCLSYPEKTILLACTDEINNLKYRIRGYAKSGSAIYNELWAETQLAHGDIQPFVVEKVYDIIVVEAKSARPGQPASYALDYCGGRVYGHE